MSRSLSAGSALAAASLGALGALWVSGCSTDAAGPMGIAGASQAGGPGVSGSGAGEPGGAPTIVAGAGGQSAGGSASPLSGSGGEPPAGGGSAGLSAGGGSAGLAAGGGSAGAAAGAGGQSATICEVAPTEAQRKAPAFPATKIPNPTGLRFRFMNNCPMTIWVKASNPGNQFPGNNGVVELAAKATAEFDMAKVLGRIEAYTKAAPNTAGSVLAQFSEMNAEPNKAFNVNLSHVDWLALPVEIKGVGTDKSCTVTACYHPYASLLTGCPTELLDTKEGKCHAPNWYCGAHAAEPFCQALMASATNTLNNDPDCVVGKGRPFTPNDVFGCAGGFFSSQPPNVEKNGAACCAKVNRNYQGNATTQTHLNNCGFYKAAPYNVYAKWAHQQCPFIYAFAYDDVAEQSGYNVCAKGTEMDITYCPGDP